MLEWRVFSNYSLWWNANAPGMGDKWWEDQFLCFSIWGKFFVGCRSWIVQQISMISISSFCHLFRHCHNFSFTRTLWLNAYFPVCTWVLHSLWNRFLGNSLGTRRAFPTTIGKQMMCILDMFLADSLLLWSGSSWILFRFLWIFIGVDRVVWIVTDICFCSGYTVWLHCCHVIYKRNFCCKLTTSLSFFHEI